MQSVGYWDAWSLWWSGQKVDGMRLWGLPLLVWGRIGKLLQFTGGLIVIFDLVGSDRLNKAASRVHRRAERIRHNVWRRDLGLELPEATRRSMNKADRYLLGVVLAVVLGLLAWIAVDHFDVLHLLLADPTGSDRIVAYLVRFVVVVAVAMAVLGAILLTSALISGAHLPLLALAWIFDSSRPGHPARWTAFFVVVAGFHFDLLAS